MVKIDGPQHASDATIDLFEAARRLGNDRIIRVLDSFREERAAFARVVLTAIVLVWVYFWRTGPQPLLVQEANAVFPWTLGIFIASTLWYAVLRGGIVKPAPWMDAGGVVANLIFIAIQLKLAFILLITLNALLPFISIAVGARFSKRAFLASLIATFAILIATAPGGYWLSRPAYALYAITLTIGLPLVIARILNALRDATIESIQARDAQSRFISTMSHELRTPLNSLTNSAILIDVQHLAPDQQVLMQSVTYNANALLHRVNEVIDVAGIERGRMRLHEESFRILHIVRTVQAVCSVPAKETGVRFTVEMGEGSAINLVGDGGRIEQAITNLVSNAIKFTPSGGEVKLEIARLASQNPHMARIMFRVTDTGIGIPDEKKPEIFAPFHQVSDGPTRRYGGIGLGLHIVRSISDLMGGELSVTDNPRGGTIFTWTLDLKLSCDQAAAVTQTVHEALQQHRETHDQLNCVVFEDAMSNQLVIQRILELAGHKVTFHETGDDALEKIQGADLVFLDLHMPGKSGYDVLEQLDRAGAGVDLPPLIITSADTTATALDTARSEVVSGLLSKPLSPMKLLDMIDKVVASREAQPA